MKKIREQDAAVDGKTQICNKVSHISLYYWLIVIEFQFIKVSKTFPDPRTIIFICVTGGASAAAQQWQQPGSYKIYFRLCAQAIFNPANGRRSLGRHPVLVMQTWAKANLSPFRHYTFCLRLQRAWWDPTCAHPWVRFCIVSQELIDIAKNILKGWVDIFISFYFLWKAPDKDRSVMDSCKVNLVETLNWSIFTL